MSQYDMLFRDHRPLQFVSGGEIWVEVIKSYNQNKTNSYSRICLPYFINRSKDHYKWHKKGQAKAPTTSFYISKTKLPAKNQPGGNVELAPATINTVSFEIEIFCLAFDPNK
ncbi:hypothetical protein RF11_15552 [Thelohanellus kitauei]|uniref:Uncharacterized protein n=1 Tax=Thelohanellus kitauei TaxID=669202 RepID=A0A0C2J800_THEKT|nr:hypothetical protein RF11_15552 [Thelohanellus kitauei]